jgi:hypothetical protein
VYLSWTDNSLCETGFGFDRLGATFTPDYLVNSDAVCFTNHAPTNVYDDLTVAQNIAVNSVQTYCFRATNQEGYDSGYRSDPTCQDITIAWEASVRCLLWLDTLFHCRIVHLVVYADNRHRARFSYQWQAAHERSNYRLAPC